MKRCIGLAGLLVILGWSAEVRASDTIGCYAIIDKVVLEPNEDSPTKIQIWGTFARAKEPGSRTYGAPAYGCLYFVAEKGKEDVCRKEWADMKKLAGKGQVIAFGSSYELKNLGRIQTGGGPLDKPETYPLGFGLSKIGDDSDFGPIKDLRAFPVPADPGDGGLTPKGKVTLVARNIVDKKHAKAAYIFEIEGPDGVKEISKEVDAGDKETKWTPKMELKGGEKYTWRVHAVDGTWKGPTATAKFETKK